MIGTQQRSDLQHAIEDACERLTTMVMNAPDLDVRVPDTPKWTARQAFAHVVTVTPRYTAGARQTGRWVDAWPHLAALNDEEIAAAGSLDVTALATRLRAELAELFAEVSSFGPQAPEYAFHGGATVAADAALRCLLGEFEIHGRDIARALGHPWTIAPAHARLILDGAWCCRPTPWRACWSSTAAGRNGQRSSAAGCWPGAAGRGWPCPSSSVSTRCNAPQLRGVMATG